MEILFGLAITFFIIHLIFNLDKIGAWLLKVVNLPLELLSEKVRQIKLDNDLKEHEVNKFKNNTNR